MTEFFQIAGMLTPAIERLKSSVRKASPCSPRWWRLSTVVPSGPRTVEEAVFLMAAATPLSTNGLFQRSTKWWRWISLLSLLRFRSCGIELAVNCLLNALTITFEFQRIFPSKVIEIFGWGLNHLRSDK